MENNLSFESELIHVSFPKCDVYHSLSMPIYQTAAYEFETAEQMEAAFIGKTADHTYSRITNPTVDNFESKVKKITGAASVTALNSGMAAICNVFMNIASTGSNVVASKHLFGNTYSLLANTLAAFGVEARFCDFTNIDEVSSRIDGNTCAIFFEIISNPQMEVVDIQALGKLSTDKNVPLIADTTMVPFGAFSASDWGVNIEVVSSTKYISGGATSLGGLILDYATFDWSNSRTLKQFASQFHHLAFTTRLRKEIHRNIGAYMTPQVAHLQSLGLDTLTLRYKRASTTCLELTKSLARNEKILAVNYPSLKSHPHNELSERFFGETSGAMFTFNLDSRESCFRFLNNLKMIRRATNLFDNKSLAIHPASTIYGTFTDEVREGMGVHDNTIRISVGLESIDDLLNDINQALILK